MSAPTAYLTNVNGLPYYVPLAKTLTPSEPPRLLFGNNASSSLGPATLFVLSSPPNPEALTANVKSWLQTDDVFTTAFLASVYFLIANTSSLPSLGEGVEALLSEWGTKSAHVLYEQDDQHHATAWRSGPYFTSADSLWPAWRIFPDLNSAFVFPVVPSEENSRKFVIPGTAGVPVPSRCFFEPASPKKPLSGMRVVIKDNIDMHGVTTSAGNRAYGELYGAKAKNADVVERLLDAGAVIIGRVKTVQFAAGANAKDWFDFQAPFNPRGEGYQDPGCSSAGSATAVSAYDWVDIALGTDTFGSVIGPASEHGLFALRPTIGSVSTAGVVPQSHRELDTVGLLSRTVKAATAATRALMSTDLTKRFCAARTQLIFPVDFFDNWPEEYLRVVEPVISKLEDFLKVKRTRINIRAKFREDGVGGSKSMEEYLDTTTAHIQLYDCYRNCLPFLKEYEARFNKTPFADPYIKYKWGLGKALTDGQYQEAITRRNVYRDWMLNTILPQSYDSDFSKILIMPNGYMDPFYRHEYDARTLEEGAHRKQGFGFKDSFVTALPGLPFFNVPIGQFPYESSVSNRTEYLSTNIAFMGPRGSDYSLVQLLEEFLHSSPELHSSVGTGSTLFAVKAAPTPSL
ncbi:amidase signature domain-containing protein [Nemania sp. FL0031]|nr:amidase signature domain-containing protein [Nemania sp. FL0031]